MKGSLSSAWRILAGTLMSTVVFPLGLLLIIEHNPGLVSTRGGVDLKDLPPILTALVGVVCGPLNLFLAWRADRRNAREMNLKVEKLQLELQSLRDQVAADPKGAIAASGKLNADVLADPPLPRPKHVLRRK